MLQFSHGCSSYRSEAYPPYTKNPSHRCLPECHRHFGSYHSSLSGPVLLLFLPELPQGLLYQNHRYSDAPPALPDQIPPAYHSGSRTHLQGLQEVLPVYIYRHNMFYSWSKSPSISRNAPSLVEVCPSPPWLLSQPSPSRINSGIPASSKRFLAILEPPRVCLHPQ